MLAVAKIISLRTLLLLAAVLAASIGAASAATPETGVNSDKTGGITMEPTFKELTLGSGLVEATTKITLTNNSGLNIVANVKAVDFSALQDSGGISFGQAGQQLSKYGLAKWVTLPGGSSITIPSGITAVIPVHIQNREDMAPGGHYGAIVVTASPAGAQGGNRIAFRQEVVSLLFVKKLGGEQYGLRVESMRANEQRSIPSAVSTRFESTGNVHVAPRGYVTVTDPRGKVVAKGTINPESTLVLPGQTRTFETLLQPVAASDVPGRYKITAYYRHDDKKDFDTYVIHFNRWKFPRMLLAALALTGAAILGTALLLRRKNGRRKYFRR